jgi:hypothetical protein
MSIEQKKFKRLRKELQFVQSELEYVLEVLKEWHLEFENYHRQYCKNRGIDLEQLNKKNKEKVSGIIPKPAKKKQTGLVVYEDDKEEKVFKKSTNK